MKKKRAGRSKVEQLAEAQEVVAMRQAARELEESKREVASHLESGETALEQEHPGAGEVLPIGSILAAGQTDQQVWTQVNETFKEFFNALGNYVFSLEHRQHYFPERKVTYLVGLLKGAGYTMQSVAAMDIFKDRVKQLQGGQMPKITEKTGLFSKSITRPMTLSEIAQNFEIEENLPTGEVQSLTRYAGTQRGLLDYIRSSLLDEDEEILNPLKSAQRKQLARFLKGLGLLDLKTKDRREKVIIACLLTPDLYQPKSPDDMEHLPRFRSLIKKGILFLQERIEAQADEPTEPEEK